MDKNILAQEPQEVKPEEYGCNCVLPEQSCPDCEAEARAVYDNDDGELPF